MAHENLSTENSVRHGVLRWRSDARTGPQRKNDRPEAACLLEVMKTLRGHPAVAWVERQNSGGFKDGLGQFVRFGWPGCSDILGQLRDGRILAVEVKAPGGRLSESQQIFLNRVRAAGGVAFVATSAVDVIRNIPEMP